MNAPPTLDKVAEAVCDFYSLPLESLRGHGRRNSIVHPRQMFMHLARVCTRAGVAEIGEYLDNRNHTTVVKGCQAFRARMQDSAGIELVTRTLMDNLMRGTVA